MLIYYAAGVVVALGLMGYFYWLRYEKGYSYCWFDIDTWRMQNNLKPSRSEVLVEFFNHLHKNCTITIEKENIPYSTTAILIDYFQENNLDFPRAHWKRLE